jgi:rod shape-determining protein MreC
VRNFILIIRRFFNLILFAGLEIICFILIAHSHTLQGDDIVSSANTATGLIYKKQTDLFYYISLGKMNDSLLSDNVRLRKIVDQYRTLDTLRDSFVHKALVNTDTTVHVIKYADYVYRTAKVINNSVDGINNYITIDRGSKHGIAKGMSVISSTGLVGRVEYVSANFACILSILSNKQQVSAKLKDGTFKSTVWDNEHPETFLMKDMPPELKVKRGDSVFTTSFGSVFPPDVLIGRIAKIEMNKKNGKQQLFLTPATNFRNLQYVYVLENLMAAEQKQLEELPAKK